MVSYSLEARERCCLNANPVNMAGNLSQVIVSVQQITSISSLKQRPTPVVAPVEVRGIARPQAVHHLAQVRSGGLHEELNAAIHQDKSIKLESKLGMITTEEFEKAMLISIVPEQGLPVASSYH